MTLLGSEPLRAAVELVKHVLTPNPSADRKGDGHPIIVFPGLGSDGTALAPLRKYCNELGYHALDWQMGRNTGPDGDIDAWMRHLAGHTADLLKPFRKRATLIGWSLGGLYAREVAKLLKPRVRQVITIGTPFNWTEDHTNIAWLARLLKGDAAAIDETLSARLRSPPMVPTTSLYSRGDGVVAWQSCRHSRRRKNVEDIEIEGSHLGMGWNQDVMKIVADRLAQVPRRWRPLKQVA